MNKIILFVLVLLNCSLTSVAQDYEGAITAKMSDIKAKQAELQAAKRELAILEEFLDNYNSKVNDIDGICGQLTSADSTLAGIQQDNLVKLTILMGIQTYTEVSDAINLGKSVAQAMVTNGIKGVVSHVAQEQASKYLTSEAKAALGLDDETLSKPRVQKIKAVSDVARNSYPELDRVQKTLALSLEAVKSAAYYEDGTELGDTGAILRKNIMVRDAIGVALSNMESIKTSAAEAKADADINLPLLQEEVTGLENDLQTLQNELDALKSGLEEEDLAARAAANDEAVPEPEVRPVSGKEEEESSEQYCQRLAAIAQAAWNTESPSLIDVLTNTQDEIATLQNEIDSALDLYIKYPGAGYFYDLTIDDFIFEYGDGDALDVDMAGSYSGSISSYAAVQEDIDDMVLVEAALPGIITKIEELTDLYNTLFDMQNQLESLSVFVSHSCLSWPYLSEWDAEPGMGQVSAERLAIRLDQKLIQLKVAIRNASSLRDKFGAATDAWSGGIVYAQTDFETNLEAAETALAGLIEQAEAWENILASSSDIMLGHLAPENDIYSGMAGDPPFFSGRLGYFSENQGSFTHILKHAFLRDEYRTRLLDALIIPGAEGLVAARSLRAQYDAMVAATPSIQDAYDGAWQAYNSAFARVKSYASGEALPVYDDWLQASAYTSDAHPVDVSAITDQAVRFLRLYNTSYAIRRTGLTGGALAGGEGDDEILIWAGLPRMTMLPDHGLDDPEAYYPHRIVAMKALIVEEGQIWINLPEDEFLAQFNDADDQIWGMRMETGEDVNVSTSIVLEALDEELQALQTAYYENNPAPEITVQPSGPAEPVQAGETINLSVSATGNLMTYQWSMATEFEYSMDLFSNILGAVSSSLTTPALYQTRWFRVEIKNPGGTVYSDPVRIEISGGSSGIVFTSTASAFGQAGTAFTWTFTTEPATMVTPAPGTEIPSGLTFMAGALSGTPSSAGTWDIAVMASLPPSPGQPLPVSVQQVFHLTITEQDNPEPPVNLADAIIILKIISENVNEALPESLKDIDGDGKLGLAEAIGILKDVIEVD